MQKEKIAFYMKRIQDAMERQANNNLRRQDLTMMQLGVLLYLNERALHELPLKELERFFGVAQPTMAGIVKRLEQKGFVESFGSDTDKRVKMIRITETGIGCCREAGGYMDESEKQLLSGLTQAEQQVFLILLKKICDTIEE